MITSLVRGLIRRITSSTQTPVIIVPTVAGRRFTNRSEKRYRLLTQSEKRYRISNFSRTV